MTLKRRACSCIAAAVLLATAAIAGRGQAVEQERAPEQPKAPDVADVAFRDPHEYSRAAGIELAGGVTVKGTLFFGSPSMRCICQKGGETADASQDIGRIRSLQITRWVPQKYGRDQYIFYPSDMTLHIDGGEVLKCTVPRELRSFLIHDGRRRRRLFAFFYDDWVGKGWRNTRREDFCYPMDHPLRGTVVKVTFRQEN
ncbi:MAG: hypothetical protein JXA20_15790 [Spirochaetes bacterium]|nr:hypothetical protein [Spirochaetota bacterium]